MYQSLRGLTIYYHVAGLLTDVYQEDWPLTDGEIELRSGGKETDLSRNLYRPHKTDHLINSVSHGNYIQFDIWDLL